MPPSERTEEGEACAERQIPDRLQPAGHDCLRCSHLGLHHLLFHHPAEGGANKESSFCLCFRFPSSDVLTLCFWHLKIPVRVFSAVPRAFPKTQKERTCLHVLVVGLEGLLGFGPLKLSLD